MAPVNIVVSDAKKSVNYNYSQISRATSEDPRKKEPRHVKLTLTADDQDANENMEELQLPLATEHDEVKSSKSKSPRSANRVGNKTGGSNTARLSAWRMDARSKRNCVACSPARSSDRDHKKN